MMGVLPAAAAILFLGPGAALQAASYPARAGAASQATAVATRSAETPDLGISIVRIRRGLRELPPSPAVKDALRLSYYIQVYGSMPSWRIFEGVDLSGGAFVRYGGMTHAEFLRLTTPRGFSLPAGSLPVPKKKQR